MKAKLRKRYKKNGKFYALIEFPGNQFVNIEISKGEAQGVAYGDVDVEIGIDPNDLKYYHSGGPDEVSSYLARIRQFPLLED